MSPRRAAVERLYETFGGYALPRQLWVCSQCGPDWSDADIRATPLAELTLAQLGAVHVMSLDDDALRHFLPRLLDVLLETEGPVFDFRVSDLKGRLPGWRPEERAAVVDVATAVWAELGVDYPAESGFFADIASAMDLLDWCGLSLTAHLDTLLAGTGLPSARHLADLVDAVFTVTAPFQTAPKETVLAWISRREVGDRLQEGFFAAGSEEVAAQQLSGAHELWTVCGRRP